MVFLNHSFRTILCVGECTQGSASTTTQHICRWCIGDVFSMNMDHSGYCVWIVSCSLHVKNCICRFKNKVSVLLQKSIYLLSLHTFQWQLKDVALNVSFILYFFLYNLTYNYKKLIYTFLPTSEMP